MYVKPQQIKNGIQMYLERELMTKVQGWQKWLIGAGASIMLEKSDNLMIHLTENPLVHSLDLVDAEGEIDIETIYRHFLAEAQKGPVTFNVPMLGNVTMKDSDVDQIYQCILQAGY